MDDQTLGITQKSHSQPVPKGLVIGSTVCFLLFWLGVILGKLRIAYRLDVPAVPELGLLLMLVLAIILGLAACLQAERRRDQSLRNNK